LSPLDVFDELELADRVLLPDDEASSAASVSGSVVVAAR
jgi:hypothetical protein